MKELDGYRTYMMNQHKYMSKTSIDNIIGGIKEFLRIMQIDTIDQLKMLKRVDIETYISKIKEKNSDNTNKTKMARVRMFFNYLFENDLIDKNIAAGKKIVCGEIDRLEFSHSDGVKVLNQVKNERDYVLLNTLLGTAIRISSLISLECKNIDDSGIYVHAKGDKYSWVFCVKKVTDALHSYIENTKNERGESKYVFFSDETDYGYISKSCVNNIIKKYAEKAQIKNWEHFSAHKFRHIAANYALNEQGIPIDVVSKNLMHSSVAVTSKIYAKAKDERVKEYYSNAKEKGILGRKEFKFNCDETDDGCGRE
jgi:site-specific recombinase XerD